MITSPDMQGSAAFAPSFLHTDDVARLLGVSPRTIENWRRWSSGPPYIQVGHGVRYLMSDVLAWSVSQRRGA